MNDHIPDETDGPGPADPTTPEEESTSDAETHTAVLRYGCTSCRSGCKSSKPLRRGDRVVAETERGVEYALVLTDSKAAGPAVDLPDVEVLRTATEGDEERHRELSRSRHQDEFEYVTERIQARDLSMRVVKVEKLLGGERMVFYFRAERRVDFRDLVRDLARQYKMRIELKQIGARDEAKILGDVSYCGRELCCSSWIREMKPITMKMAKNQKATLDPSKISGMCGRLLCCLRYEDEVYTELRRELPKRGTRVRIGSTGQTGIVLHQEVLASQCVVLLDRGGTSKVPGADLSPETPPEPAAEGAPATPKPPDTAK